MRDNRRCRSARYDEFGVLLTETASRRAPTWWRNGLLQNLHQTDFMIENNRLHGLASIGVVTRPDHGQDLKPC